MSMTREELITFGPVRDINHKWQQEQDAGLPQRAVFDSLLPPVSDLPPDIRRALTNTLGEYIPAAYAAAFVTVDLWGRDLAGLKWFDRVMGAYQTARPHALAGLFLRTSIQLRGGSTDQHAHKEAMRLLRRAQRYVFHCVVDRLMAGAIPTAAPTAASHADR